MDQHIAEPGVNFPVEAAHINSKRYFIKEIKPTDDEGRIGDVCFVVSEEKIVPPEPLLGTGMVLIPHSQYTITAAGGTATKKGQGQVEFTAVTSLSLDGVFTADFDNYVVSARGTGTASTNTNLYYRLRASGSDASGSNYTVQELVAESTAVSAARYTSQTQANNFLFGPSLQNGDGLYFYGPFLAQPTASRVVSVGESGGARIIEYAVTHSLSTSYDGFTFLTNSAATVTGALQVYGVRS